MKKVLSVALLASMLFAYADANAQYPTYPQQQYQQQDKKSRKKQKQQDQMQYPQQQYQQYPPQQAQYQQQYPPQQMQQYQQQYPPQQMQQYQQQYPPQQQYQQYPPQQMQQYPPQPLTEADILRQEQMRLAQEDPVQYLSLQWGDNEIRAFGVGTGFDEEAARIAARMNAENELINIMNLYAEDFTQRTNIGTQVNGVNRQERVTQQDQIRFAEGDLKGVQIVLIKCTPVNNGVECRVCLKINATAAANAVLAQAEAKQIIENAEAFRKQAEETKERIRLQRTGTNAEMTKKQAEFELQQQQQMQQHQMQMQLNQQRNQHEQQMNLQQNQYDLEKTKVKANAPQKVTEKAAEQPPVQIFQIQ